jgi:hypothetical protein
VAALTVFVPCPWPVSTKTSVYRSEAPIASTMTMSVVLFCPVSLSDQASVVVLPTTRTVVPVGSFASRSASPRQALMRYLVGSASTH